MSGGRRRGLLAVVAAGVYIPSFDRRHAEHELTQKIRRGKVSREDDEEFAELLADTARRHHPGFKTDIVVSVPERPGRDDRFRAIRSDVARRIGAGDPGAALRHTRVMEGYRRMTRAQRRASCYGRFAAWGGVRGMRVLFIDDVVTSGCQAREAVRALLAAGAAHCRFVAIAMATAAPGDAGLLAFRRVTA